jgi:hypothetical protein
VRRRHQRPADLHRPFDRRFHLAPGFQEARFA